MHVCIFKDIHVVKLETSTILPNDLLKLNNATNTFLINLIIILYCVFLLNIYEYLKYRQHQFYHD